MAECSGFAWNKPFCTRHIRAVRYTKICINPLSGSTDDPLTKKIAHALDQVKYNKVGQIMVHQ